jgi:hypothetical protein
MFKYTSELRADELGTNISQIEAWSSTIYAWYQEFDFHFFLNFEQKRQKFN